MPKIQLTSLPVALINAILHPDPLAGEDIQIEDDGKLVAAIIPANAYQFFLSKVEEREDEIDSRLTEGYSSDAKTLDDFMKEMDDEQ